MRSAFRLFVASILLSVAAGFAGAQEAEPRPPAPDAAVPVAELPPIPFASPVQDPKAPAVNPALTIDPSVLAVNTAKQPVEKPVAKPAIEATESYGPMPAEAGVAAASTAPAESNAPPPVAKSVIVETPAERTEPRAGMGIGSWILAGMAVTAMFGLITLFRRRSTPRKTSIVPQLERELEPVPVARYW